MLRSFFRKAGLRMSKILEFLWGLLPDTCEVADCCRKGMRGNEKISYPFDWEPDMYIVMCDYIRARCWKSRACLCM